MMAFPEFERLKSVLLRNGCPKDAVDRVEDEMMGEHIRVPTLAAKLRLQKIEEACRMFSEGSTLTNVQVELGVSRQTAVDYKAICNAGV